VDLSEWRSQAADTTLPALFLLRLSCNLFKRRQELEYEVFVKRKIPPLLFATRNHRFEKPALVLGESPTSP
jgi:hypothetical protein